MSQRPSGQSPRSSRRRLPAGHHFTGISVATLAQVTENRREPRDIAARRRVFEKWQRRGAEWRSATLGRARQSSAALGRARSRSALVGGRRCGSRPHGVHESRFTEPRPACRPPEPWRCSSRSSISSASFVRVEFLPSVVEWKQSPTSVRRASRDVDVARTVRPVSLVVAATSTSLVGHRRRRRRREIRRDS